MPTIHDVDYCARLVKRVDALTAGAKPQWGEMSVGQMVWHVNGALAMGLGKLRAEKVKSKIPLPLLVPLAMYMPIPKNMPTMPEIKPMAEHDLEHERARFHQFIDEFALRPLHFNWLEHPMFGRLSGPQWSRIQAKHLDHHLRQFGV